MKRQLVRVLLVEDDEDDYVITRSLLSEVEDMDVELEWLKTYESALARIMQNQHDVCLIDYQLGECSGLDLLEAAIAHSCAAPIILLTGQGNHDVDVAAMKAGAANYLLKDRIDTTTLERTIRYALERTRTLEELRQALQEKSLLVSSIANLSIGLIITDATVPENPIIFANPGFTQITGYSLEEIKGFNCRLLQGKDTDPVVLHQLREAIAAQRSITCTLLNYRKDGTPFWNELKINPIFDDTGKLIHFIGLQTDVTERQKAQEALERLQHRNELILNSAGEGIYGLDLQGNATFVNPAAARMLGWEVDELVGKPIDAILHHADPHLRPFPQAACLIHPDFHDGKVHRVEDETFWRKDGTCFWVEYISTPIWENNKLVGTVVTFQDITERRLGEEALRESEERYALAVQGANDGIWDWNLRTNEVYYSPRWKSMLGYQDSEIGTTVDDWFERVHPEDLDWVKMKITAHLNGLTPYFENEHRMRHQDGAYRWMLSRGLAVRDSRGDATRIAGSQTDITGRKQAEERLLHNAFYDALTDLPNRALLVDRLQHAIHRAKRNPSYLFAVLFLDLDRFKVINDSLGHMLGDQLLVIIAQRLTNCIRPGDTVARLGGDEFVILLEDIKEVASAISVANRIQQELTQPFNLGGHEVFTTASIGIALSTLEYDRSEDLLRDADTAMYWAKAQGRARHEIFSINMHTRAVALLQLETDLRRAVSTIQLDQSLTEPMPRDAPEFLLHYQPIVALKSRHIIGFEALLRWQHPQRGMISPAEFVPISEETGLIVPLGTWVLREACRQMRYWQTQFTTIPPLTISVNLSGKQFTPQLISQVNHILNETGLDPSSLKLEITESVLMENADAAVTMLSQLKAIGIQLAVDDFGTGYSSLSHLHRFPIDTLKIDRSFISKIDRDGEQLAIVRTIMTLAWNLGMEVVAEGVETPKQLAQLRALQCEYGQGYLFSKPIASSEVINLVLAEPELRVGR
ncbi:EAL domain-containing protein [Oculatella sp. LEGE 06141]|uniref:EAL domain-containing protein n=1 Tax=Oculatella sp. LEGE 06141 TaxID=1828648 RepID=UPI00188073D6|nr:EAL domain-containing protein [Oculatella sp. LEGE 06141]MBE9178053.1 EAL domain-containing protein [Oculatella sp. LEGE 06141]